MHLTHVIDLSPTLLDSASTLLSYRNLKTIRKIVTLRNTFVEFIGAFLKRGPGKRKFIRFIHSSHHPSSSKLIGCMVPVISGKTSGPVTLPGATTTEECRSNADAELTFNYAYWTCYRQEEAKASPPRLCAVIREEN
jgi:hypothetical protein